MASQGVVGQLLDGRFDDRLTMPGAEEGVGRTVAEHDGARVVEKDDAVVDGGQGMGHARLGCAGVAPLGDGVIDRALELGERALERADLGQRRGLEPS